MSKRKLRTVRDLIAELEKYPHDHLVAAYWDSFNWQICAVTEETTKTGVAYVQLDVSDTSGGFVRELNG